MFHRYQSAEAGHGDLGWDNDPAFGEVPTRNATWAPAGRDYSGLRLKTAQFPDAMCKLESSSAPAARKIAGGFLNPKSALTWGDTNLGRLVNTENER